MKYPLFAGLICVCLVSGCNSHQPRKVDHAFYYWKSSFNLTGEEVNYLRSLQTKKLYVKFFDVDWNRFKNVPEPVGDLVIITQKLSVNIIPTVFITNRALINIADSLVSPLSDKIITKIIQKLSLFEHPAIKEIQLDCDWTAKTREKYFKLVSLVKEKLFKENIITSVTIRLHQVKYYKKTGVPPAYRGVLMFYNMSSVSDIRTENSIFDKDIAEKYLTNFDKYPLDLDVALPAFSWGVLFRSNNIIALINNISREHFSPEEVKQIDKNRYQAVKEFVLGGNYIRRNDIIRIEEVLPETTMLAAEMIAPHIKNDSLSVIIFNINGEVVRNYEKEYLQDIFDTFR